MSSIITEPSLLSAGPLVSGLPSWFQDLQASAWGEFEALPFPTRKDETWRFSTVKGLALDRYVLASESTADVSAPVQDRTLEETAGRIVFLNDRLVAVDLF